MTDCDLIVCRSVPQALEALAQHDGAMPVAGATDFIPLVGAGRWRPTLAVDISRLDDLRFVREEDGGLEIGALTTMAELVGSPLVRGHAPALADAAAQVAGPQVRSRATLGGNICTASPAADTVPPLLVLDAQVILVGAGGERRLLLSEFLTGPGRTELRRIELLRGVFIPRAPAGAGVVFEKLGRRKALVISMVNAAALLTAEGGRIQEARLALGAVAPTVVRCAAAEERLVGRVPDDALWTVASELVREAIRPIDDVRASAGYRRFVAQGLARRALVGAWERCVR